jgi:hypothetical protein
LSVIADLFDGKLGVGQFPAARQPAYKTLISAANRRSRWQRDLTKHPSGPIILFPATLAMFGTVIDAPLSASTNAACVQRALLELSVGTREKLGKLPLPGGMSCGLAEKACLSPKRPVVFECVGTPGVLQSILDGAPFFTRVVVVGVCMQPDTLEPAMGINKEIHLRFVLAYSPLEFRDTHLPNECGSDQETGCISALVALDAAHRPQVTMIHRFVRTADTRSMTPPARFSSASMWPE